MSAGALYRGVLPGPNLRWAACSTGGLLAEATRRHGLESGSAELLGEGIVAAALLAALQKGEARINLQLECDGPLRGMFVDASAGGDVRGYVKERALHGTAAVLGRSGFLSVLRELGPGEVYRSSVDLAAMALGPDLERYFASSDQVPTRVALTPTSGVLVQCLPGADPAELSALTQGLTERVRAGPVPKGLFGAEPVEVLATYPLRWTCGCSLERVKRALTTMGPDELRELIEKEGKASAQCQFCGARYELNRAELQALLSA